MVGRFPLLKISWWDNNWTEFSWLNVDSSHALGYRWYMLTEIDQFYCWTSWWCSWKQEHKFNVYVLEIAWQGPFSFATNITWQVFFGSPNCWKVADKIEIQVWDMHVFPCSLLRLHLASILWKIFVSVRICDLELFRVNFSCEAQRLILSRIL